MNEKPAPVKVSIIPPLATPSFGCTEVNTATYVKLGPGLEQLVRIPVSQSGRSPEADVVINIVMVVMEALRGQGIVSKTAVVDVIG